MSNKKSIEAVYLATVTQLYLKSSLNPILYYEITEPLHALSLVNRCMRVCKHSCDVSDLRVLLRIIYKRNIALFPCLQNLVLTLTGLE